MLNFKVIGCGAAGNKAAIELIESGYNAEQVLLINSTPKDIPQEYRSKSVIFGGGLGGCGKERSLGKKMLLTDVAQSKFTPESMISSRDKGVIIVGSTEGGSGSSVIPFLAKYFKEVMNLNVICVLFFGFQDDTRGMQNSIELAQELSDEYTICAISNAKFLKEANNNRFKAEKLANKKFIDIVNILNGSAIKPGSQVIDDTDLYKIIYTPGYLMADKIPLSNLGTLDDFNSIVVDAIKNHHFIDPPAEPGVKRRGLIFDIKEPTDTIDYSGTVLNNIFGNPYESFINLSEGANEYNMYYIVSGMKLPIEELTTLYNNYISSSRKVDKSKDTFFSNLAEMKGNSEDSQFDMFNQQSSKKSKSEFLSELLGSSSNMKISEY